MGGLEIDPHSQVLDTGKKPIKGLFASGEIAGGVHGANRLGGSSLLGCVVFGRVAGETAASYLLKSLSSGSSGAAARLGQVNGHLQPPSTTVTIDPSTQQVHLTFNWAGQGGQASSGAAGDVKPTGQSTAEQPANEVDTAVKQDEKTKKEGGKDAKELKEYSLDEVAKHNKKDDIWIAVNGQVLNVTNFLNDHPGGAKALLLYAGKEASEEFNMLHDAKVVAKYAPDTIVGTYKQE
ncbi:Osmotic growth protein [Rhodotorula kratochvilovae]